MTVPALLLLPGLVCDRDVWSPVLPSFAEVAACTVCAYHDRSTLAAMAQRVLDEAPPRFALVGHSMGARVALEVLRAAPERVRRVALLASGHQALEPGEAGERERTFRHGLLALARTQGMRAMGLRWVQGMVHPKRLADADLIERIVAMIARQTPAMFEAQIEALLGRPDATGVLASIACPALVLCARADTWAPVARHERMASLVPGSRFAVIEDCGHMMPMERPQAVAQALRAWLEAPRAGASAA